MAHAVEGHLRGTAQRPRPFAWPEGPAAWPEREPPEAGHLCLTGLGWSLAQSLRRYAAWALELASAGALATVVLALLGPAGAGSEATAAALWVGIGAGALLILRGRDPLRQAEKLGRRGHRPTAPRTTSPAGLCPGPARADPRDPR